MKLIICLDENKGMLFNNRRQSRDSILIERVLELAEGKRLIVTPYSAKLFPQDSVSVCEDIFAEVTDSNICFAEQKIESLEGINTIYVFLWNRKYPADVKFDFDLTAEGLVLSATEEFVGSSHEKITLEIYKR